MRRMTHLLPFLLGLLAFPNVALAQYPAGASGLQWTGASGTAGTFCWGNTCSVDRVRVTAGERVELLVRGEYQAPYVFLMSTSASSCVPLAGVFGSLVVDPPFHLGWSGILASQSPILACPPGSDTWRLVFPSGIPTGSTLALQVLCLGANAVPSLTSAIVAQVR